MTFLKPPAQFPAINGSATRRNVVFFLVSIGFINVVGIQPALSQFRSETVAVSGNTAPGSGTFLSFGTPVNRGGGQVAFTATLNDTASMDTGIFASSINPTFSTLNNTVFDIAEVVREGDAAPNNAGGTNGSFSTFSQPLSYSQFGQVFFQSQLNQTVGVHANSGIFQGVDNFNNGFNVREVVRGGNQLPNGSSSVFSIFGSVAVGNFGNFGFVGFIDDGAGNTTSGVFDANPTIQPLALEGQTAADGNGTYSAFGQVAIGDSGSTVFEASISNGDKAIYSVDINGIVNKNVRTGDFAPGSADQFQDLFDISSNNSGQVVFGAQFDSSTTAGGTANDYGVYLSDSNGLTRVIREGDFINSAIGVVGEPNSRAIINNSGTVTVRAGYGSGSILIARKDNGDFYEIARTGDQIGGNQIDPTGNFAVARGNDLNKQHNSFVVFQANHVGGGSGLYIGDGIETINVVSTGQTTEGSSITSLGFAGNTNSIHSGLAGFDGQVAYRATLADGREVVKLWTPDIEWRTLGDGNWSDVANWTLGIAPGRAHDVFIFDRNLPNRQVDVLLDGSSHTVRTRTLTVGGITGGRWTLNLNGGTVIVDGFQIAPNGFIEGEGTIVGDVFSNGVVSPGNSPGVLDINGSLELSADSDLLIELAGVNTNSFDRLDVSGDMIIGGDLMVDLIDGFTLDENQQFLIAEIDGASSGQFIGFGQDASIGRYGNYELRISYSAGDGNDIALYSITAVPEPNSWSFCVLALILVTTIRWKRKPLPYACAMRSF